MKTNANITRAERYLMEIRKIEGIMKRYTEMAEEQRQLIETISSPVMDPLRTSGGSSEHDKLGESIARLEKHIEKLNTVIARLTEQKQEALELISQIDDYDLQNILISKYIQNKTMEEICEEFDKEERWFYRRRTQALNKLGIILAKKDKCQ